MKVADIQLYMNDLDDDDVVYTAVMEGFVGSGLTPQEALANLPEVIGNAVLKRLHVFNTQDMELAHHFLCEPGQRLRDWIEANKGGEE